MCYKQKQQWYLRRLLLPSAIASLTEHLDGDTLESLYRKAAMRPATPSTAMASGPATGAALELVAAAEELVVEELEPVPEFDELASLMPTVGVPPVLIPEPAS